MSVGIPEHASSMLRKILIPKQCLEHALETCPSVARDIPGHLPRHARACTEHLKHSERIRSMFRHAWSFEHAWKMLLPSGACPSMILKHTQRLLGTLPKHALSIFGTCFEAFLGHAGARLEQWARSMLGRSLMHLQGHARICTEQLGTFSGPPPRLDHDLSMRRRVWDIPGHAQACLEHAQKTSGNILRGHPEHARACLKHARACSGHVPWHALSRHRVSCNIPSASSRDTKQACFEHLLEAFL
jgi:hypothetical protein